MRETVVFSVFRDHYVCGQRAPGEPRPSTFWEPACRRRCAFFRWADECDMFSRTQARPTLSASDVRRATADVNAQDQLAAWSGPWFTPAHGEP